MEEIMILEDKKIEFIKTDIDKIIGEKYQNVEEIRDFLKREYCIEADGGEVGEDIRTDDKEINLLFSVNANYGYIDIYVSRDNNGFIVKEIAVNEE